MDRLSKLAQERLRYRQVTTSPKSASRKETREH